MSASTIPALINPLAFLQVDEPWAAVKGEEVTLEHILSFATNPGEPRDIAALVARYKRISVEDPRLFAAPAEARLLERMIWPLRQAKANFMLGHNLATLSLCGMVAEMAAILTFDLGRVALNGQPMNDANQRALFGSTFERQGQERRVDILAGYGLISADLKMHYDTVRTARRRYLHLWSADHAALEADAIAAFRSEVAPLV